MRRLFLLWLCVAAENVEDDVVLRAVAASDGGRYVEAVRLFASAARADPTEPAAWANLGVAWLRRGNAALVPAEWADSYARALTHLRRAIRLDPSGTPRAQPPLL
jgi:Flp pilus assembly protein TadD